jgi:hypothetical protein
LFIWDLIVNISGVLAEGIDVVSICLGGKVRGKEIFRSGG